MSADPAPKHEVQTAQEAFKELLRAHVAPALKPHGFKRQGQTFGRRGDGVWGVINFQKSQWTGRDSVEFTINVGVCADGRNGAPPDGERVPSVTTCSWQRRIGCLMPSSADRWWTIEEPRRSWDPTLTPLVVAEVLEALERFAVPALLGAELR